MNIKIQTVFIFAVSGYESVLRYPDTRRKPWWNGSPARKIVLITIRSSGVFIGAIPSRGLDVFRTVMKFLTDLVSHDFSDTLNITTETKAVFLYIYISKFGYELV